VDLRAISPHRPLQSVLLTSAHQRKKIDRLRRCQYGWTGRLSAQCAGSCGNPDIIIVFCQTPTLCSADWSGPPV
jgi:hypothetical protein